MNPFATRSKSAFIALADRHGERLLAAAAGLMALFFISFLWVLAQAVSAQAGMACGGSDLVARYQSEEPETYARLAAEAAAEVNGGHVFWRLEKDGVQPSYLLGTMHMSDVRIARLEGARLAAFNAADTVIVESVEALIEEKAAAAMLQYRNLTLYTDGTTLADRLDARTMFQLKAAAIKRGVPLPVVQIMRPWMAATVVALPACEMAAKRDGEPVLDALIARRAQTEGKELVGLETVGEQFSVMAGLPEDFHIEALKETLAMGPLAEDLMETMKQLYVSGNIGMIFPLMKIITPKTAGSKGYAEFQESMITQRNDVMAERALPYLQKGGVFMAVGALHLPGAEGLVEAFRQAGYTVSAIE